MAITRVRSGAVPVARAGSAGEHKQCSGGHTYAQAYCTGTIYRHALGTLDCTSLAIVIYYE